MGYVWLLAIAMAALLIMVAARLRGPLLTLGAAALSLGAAGYALQGRPTLAGQPDARTARAAPMPLTAARKALMGQFTAADTWMTISEAYASRGKTRDAVGVMNSAIRARPSDYAMWVGLGNALADHGRGMTPAARFAFARAAQLAPNHPAPIFFLGLAEARSGNPQLAVELWRQLLADAPADASWRPLVTDALLAVSPR